MNPPDADRIRRWLAEGETAGRFLVEGRHAVAALASSGFAIEAIVAAGGGAGDRALAELAAGVPFLALDLAEAAGLLGFAFHRGVLAVARKPGASFAGWAARARPRRIAVLDRLADPGNLGAVIRNAAAFGFDAVICSRAGASPYNAKAVRASATALFRLPVFLSEDWAGEIAGALPGLELAAAHPSPGALPLAEFARRPPGRLGLVFGSEGEGLSPAALAACRHRIAIPMSPRVESLNVACASAVFFHALGPPDLPCQPGVPDRADPA